MCCVMYCFIEFMIRWQQLIGIRNKNVKHLQNFLYFYTKNNTDIVLFRPIACCICKWLCCRSAVFICFICFRWNLIAIFCVSGQNNNRAVKLDCKTVFHFSTHCCLWACTVCMFACVQSHVDISRTHWSLERGKTF